MKCCNCKHSNLEPHELEQGLLAAVCPDCHGALLPLMNYRYWSEHHAAVTPVTTELAEEPGGAKQCPKCHGLMTKYRLGNNTQNRLELCAHCDEVWFDAGEWDLVKKLDLHEKLSTVFTDAWQRNIRKQREIASIKAHYTQLLGAEDFARVDQFKTWLDEHPHQSEIRHFIITRL